MRTFGYHGRLLTRSLRAEGGATARTLNVTDSTPATLCLRQTQNIWLSCRSTSQVYSYSVLW
jgi:hypothetical protein